MFNSAYVTHTNINSYKFYACFLRIINMAILLYL